MVEVWPAVLTAGVSFAIGQFIVSNFVGPELTDALSALLSLTSVALLLRVWQPAEIYTAGAQFAVAAVPAASAAATSWHRRRRPSIRRSCLRAYATYGILIVTVLIGQIGNFAGLSNLRAARQRHGAAASADRAAIGCVPTRGSARAPRSVPRDSASRSGNSTGPARTASRTASRRRSSSASRRSSPRRRAVSVDLPARLSRPPPARWCSWPRCSPFIPMMHGRNGAGRRVDDVRQDAPPASAADRHDRVHPLDRDGDELLRHDVVDGARPGEDRRAVPVLLGVARHDRRLPDRQRHVVQHAVRAACRRRRPSCRGSIRS